LTSELTAPAEAATPSLWRRPDLILPAIAAALILSTTTALLGTDLNQAGDDPYHLASEVQVSLALDEGANPLGPIDLQFGLQFFRFYQPLFHLTTASLKSFFGVPIVLSHNLLLVFCFALSPFALAWCYRTLGLGRWAAGAGGLLTVASVAGFGSSYEAYFNTGIVTQSFGAILVPLFVGSFTRMLRGHAGPVMPAVFFALTCVSNTPVIIPATLAGALVFLTDAWPLRRCWKPLSVFVVLTVALSSFWTVPFAVNQQRYKPVSDSVIRPRQAYWFGGVTSTQLPRLLFSGRLLDDARVRPARDVVRDEDDELIDRMNHARTKVPRAPILTVLCLAGLIVAAIRVRQFPYRFLLSGVVFSLLMYLGPDDVAWLRVIPSSERIPHIRITYLLEFCAFGLAGAAVAAVGEAAHAVCRLCLGERARLVAGTMTCVLLAVPAYVLFRHVRANAAAQVDLRDMREFDIMTRIAAPARKGFPMRLRAAYAYDMRVHWSYLSIAGLSTPCSHWAGVGPTIGRTLCKAMEPAELSVPLARKVGIGFYLTDEQGGRRLAGIKKSDGSPAFTLLEHGDNSYLLHDPAAAYAHGTRSFVAVIANDTQWLYLTQAWVLAERSGSEPPLPVRVETDAHDDSSRIAREAGMVFVLDPERVDGFRDDLGALAARGRVYSAGPIDGVASHALTNEGGTVFRVASQGSGERESEPVRVRMVSARRGGPFEFEASGVSDGIVMLAMQHNPGWRAVIDGRQVPVHAAGPDFVGVLVPAGTHRVRFHWQSTILERVTLSVSLIAWLGVLGYGGSVTIRRRRRAEALS
jgi:hypothetical protein